ncbi:hypothetical protein ACTXG7_27220 [Mycolicibacterium sp. Dal123E01]|uniref:hypothetical protein n=1 Tax=Mycolicibacterium sp. Dal123E01 TaxID=3457578 RepID=UPI00403E6950
MTTDLEVLRDRIDRAIRTGLFIVTSPVTAPLILLGLLQGVRCFYGMCNEVQLFELSGRLLDFFFPATASPVASSSAASSSAHDFEVVRDRIDRAIRTGLFVLASPVAVPIIIFGLFQAVTCAACANEPASLFNFSRRLTEFFSPPLPAAAASWADETRVVNREANVAPSPRVTTSEAGSRQARSATTRSANATSQPNAKKPSAKAPAERRTGQAHTARSAPKGSLPR